MNVDKIPNDKNDLFLKIELTYAEAQGLLGCLLRTSASGDSLTIGIELDDKIASIVNEEYVKRKNDKN